MSAFRKKLVLVSIAAAGISAISFSACKHTLVEVSSKPKAEDVAARKIIGPGGPLNPLENIDLQQLKSSVAYRRSIAWQMVTKLLEPTKLKEKLENIDSDDQTLPLWRTWYEGSEILNMFEDSYFKISNEAAKNRKPICDAHVRDMFADLLNRNMDDYGYSLEDFQKKLNQLQNSADVEGVPGTGFTMFSPAVAAHYVRNYKQLIECRRQMRNAAPPSPQNRSHCMLSEFPDGRENPTIYSDPKKLDLEHCKNDSGIVESLDIRKLGMAVAVKANWFPVHEDSKIAVFDTSAKGLKKSLDEGEHRVAGLKNLPEMIFKDIYTISTIPNVATGKRNATALSAIHFTIKQIPDWMWITLWWSDDPDKDFGEDRPDSISGVWRNYKMCVTVDFNDSVKGIDDKFRNQYPTLAASLTESLENEHTNTGNSWCSNPFIEREKLNSRTSCIGCHQHAGSIRNGNTDSVFSGNEALFPHSAREKVRDNFVADYLYSFNTDPDKFKSRVRQKVESRERFIKKHGL